MADATAPDIVVFANRDVPLPVIDLDHEGQHIDNVAKEPLAPESTDTASGHVSMQDRLLNRLLDHILPSTDLPEDGDTLRSQGNSSMPILERPGFSLQQMSINFRRFNARIGIVFVFQSKVEHLFTWDQPTQTLSFLAIWTLVCLKPALMMSLPLALTFFFIMIPSFLARHPPPPFPVAGRNFQSPDQTLATEMKSAWSTYAYTSHPVAAQPRVKPTSSVSKDFLRNMRDLQNCMEDFSQAHDAAVNLVSPYTDFSNERVSSSTFLTILITMFLSTMMAHLIPWRFILVVLGWAAVGNGHPQMQPLLAQIGQNPTLKQARLSVQTWICQALDADIVIDEPAEVREVEVFELQRRATSSNKASADILDSDDIDDDNWESWLFSQSAYEPLCQQRLASAMPEGTASFEDISPPIQWRWQDKKWTLDLLPETWVDERCITGVEVEREGGRWVYDIDTQASQGQHVFSNSDVEHIPLSQCLFRRRRWVRMVEKVVSLKR